MTPQRSLAQVDRWIDGLHRGLVQRLAQPLHEPGLVNFSQTHAALARSVQMLPSLPLSDMVLARWGRSSAGATTAGEQLPIVYVQAPPTTALQDTYPGLETTGAIQSAAITPERPVVTPLSTPRPSNDALPSVGANAAAPVERSQPALSQETLPIVAAAPASVAPRQTDSLTVPTGPTVAPESPRPMVGTRTAMPDTEPAAVRSPLSLPSASSSAPASAVSSSRSIASASTTPTASPTVGIIQRMPVKESLPPLHLAEPDQPAEEAATSPLTEPIRARQSNPSSAPTLNVGVQIVRPLAADATARPSALSLQSDTQTMTTPLPLTTHASSPTVPVVRAVNRSGPPSATTLPAASHSAVSQPVVQARASRYGSQPGPFPFRAAAPTPGSTTGVIQRTALPAAHTGSARPAVRGLTPRRAAGVNSPPVVQRMPDQVIQRAAATDKRGGEAHGANQLDLEAIVDQVQRQFMRRLEVERERRGGTSWR